MKMLLGLLIILPVILVDAQDLGGSLQDVKLDPTVGPIDSDSSLNEKPAKASDFSLGDDDDDDDDDDTTLDEKLNSPPRVSAARPLNVVPAKSAAPRIPKNQLDANKVKSQVLNDINVLRRLHGAGPLIENSGMSLGAQNWANTLMKTGKATDDPSSKYGQTNCVIRVKQEVAARECVLSWYRQDQDYDWAMPKIKPNNKRFVQLVWKNSTHVGVGVARGPLGKMFIVAFYDPNGNTAATLTQNVNSYTDMFTQVPGVTCPAGYTEYQGTCYKYHTVQQSWMNALATCAKEQATLANIKDLQMEMSIKNWPVSGKKGLAWISLNDRLNESMYMSVEGSPVSYMNWVPGEPNGKDQNCVAVDLATANGLMKDINCNTLHQFICKKPLEGEISYVVKVKLPGMVWLDDFLQQYSLAYQELGKKFDKAIRELYKSNKIFKGATIHSISYVHDPLPVVAKPKVVNKKIGKRQIAVQVNPVPPAAAVPTVAAVAAVTKPTTPKPKGPKKVVVSLVLKFGNKGIPGDPTKPLQDALKKNAGKMAQPLNEAVKILSIQIAPPGGFPATPSYCQPACATSCMSTCQPRCCYSQQQVSSPYGASPVPAQKQQFGPPAPSKAPAAAKTPAIPAAGSTPAIPQSKPACTPSATSTCSPIYSVPAPPPVVMPPSIAPCLPGPFRQCPPYSRSPVPRLQMRGAQARPIATYRRIIPRFVRPNARAVMPSNPCVPMAGSPCPVPVMSPPMPMSSIPPPMPMPMPAPFPPLPMAPPCVPSAFNPCLPAPAAPKKGAKGKGKAKGKAPAAAPVPVAAPKPVDIQGVTYPSLSISVHPPRMGMGVSPLGMPPMGAPPCVPIAGKPCVPSPPKAVKSKPKSKAPKAPVSNPCVATQMNPCGPPMMPGMGAPMMGAPMMGAPMMGAPMGPPCGPAQGMPCKPPGPKPLVIKLPAIHIKMPKQQRPPMMPQMPMPMPQMPMAPPTGCAPACTRLPRCPSYCPRSCCPARG